VPNHCENDLYIRGTEDEVAAVLVLIGADKAEIAFDFNAVIPYPEPFATMDREAEAFGWHVAVADRPAAEIARAAYVAKYSHDKDGFNSGGIDWRRDNWGTKWNAYSIARRDYEGCCLTFQTAWAPPRQIIIALAKRFPTVSFSLEYFERGMCFCGGFQCLAEDEWYDEAQPWAAGTVSDEWHTDQYHGHRGG
jgi:hypothetical protein